MPIVRPKPQTVEERLTELERQRTNLERRVAALEKDRERDTDA